MPDWSNFYFSYDVGTSTSAGWSVNVTAIQVEQLHQAYQQKLEQEQRIWERQWEEKKEEAAKRKQIAEDKVKYPLFFLKEGIV